MKPPNKDKCLDRGRLIYGSADPEASPMTPPVPLPRFNPRSDRRQKQVKHLVACGERCVLEALIAVDNGQPLDLVLRDFERLFAGGIQINIQNH